LGCVLVLDWAKGGGLQKTESKSGMGKSEKMERPGPGKKTEIRSTGEKGDARPQSRVFFLGKKS